MMGIQPTEHDIQAAAMRADIAKKERADLDEAIVICGQGKKAYAKHVLHDRTGVEPDRVYYCSQADDGTGWMPKPNHKNERLPNGHFRYELHFCYIGAPSKLYKPKTAEQLAAARVKREQKRVDALAADMPLFAPEVRSGQIVVKTKNQIRNEERNRKQS